MTTPTGTTELLSPAGTLKNMRYAFAYGADAVYAGQPRYSLRVRNNDFKDNNLEIGINEAHAMDRKFFLTSNLMPHNSKVKTYISDLEPVIELGPDALIMADPGLIMMVKDRWPEMPIHLSVQANTVNYAAVKFWQREGIERIILSRELSLDEVEEIRQRCPDIELEVFVHGALCIAYSGRCLLSGYFNHRDPNQGTCTNSCRWQYKPVEAEQTAEGVYRPTQRIAMPIRSEIGNGQRHPQADDVYMLEEKGRPGEHTTITEDEHGTYIMNSKDLRAVEHVNRLVNIGINCLKIEGRTKSHYYVARTTQSYRRAIDTAQHGEAFNPDLLGDLENLANRGYTDGFFERHHSHEYQNYIDSHSKSRQQSFVGEVLSYDPASGVAEIDVKNKFCVGDKLQLVTPQGNQDFVVENMADKHGNAITAALGSGYFVRMQLPESANDHSLLAKYLHSHDQIV
ncbi:MAG: tRNA 5-hydroxyuridine modification protein YegQ [Gammaproteobacteria bacterium]|nr:tRNA 5-hydroxyuridine modification protein YegQ [Gammaproteobacteria bacterium]NNJ96971.1 tRNA 5-hydroxyuridine modification protein YegQ [Gammaproteobacteria bacterium]